MLAWILALLAWFALAFPTGDGAPPPTIEVDPAAPISVSPLPQVDVESSPPLTPPAWPSIGIDPVAPDYPVVSPPPDDVVVSPPGDGIVEPPYGGYAPPIGPGVPDPGEGRALVLAPVEDLSLVIRESYPPQYVLQVTSALPNGCAAFEGYTIDRQGSTISIEVWNSMSTQSVSCIMLYGYLPLSIELGTDFSSGQHVTVNVNGRVLGFTAQ